VRRFEVLYVAPATEWKVIARDETEDYFFLDGASFPCKEDALFYAEARNREFHGR